MKITYSGSTDLYEEDVDVTTHVKALWDGLKSIHDADNNIIVLQAIISYVETEEKWRVTATIEGTASDLDGAKTVKDNLATEVTNAGLEEAESDAKSQITVEG